MDIYCLLDTAHHCGRELVEKPVFAASTFLNRKHTQNQCNKKEACHHLTTERLSQVVSVYSSRRVRVTVSEILPSRLRALSLDRGW